MSNPKFFRMAFIVAVVSSSAPALAQVRGAGGRPEAETSVETLRSRVDGGLKALVEALRRCAERLRERAGEASGAAIKGSEGAS
jgi:hypothetical protein